MAPHHNNVHWREVDSTSSTSSRHSEGSDSNESYNARHVALAVQAARPPMPQYGTCYGRVEGTRGRYYNASAVSESRSSVDSVDTYASTSDEEDDLEEEEDDDDDYPPYEVPEHRRETFPSDAIPATPRDFAELFPSMQKLSIRHDDATIDGNMNLRIDAQVETRRGKQAMTLFHLRMHDLKSRDFSLRRYCRDSGREVCHSIRKYQKPPSERPALQRSFSSAIATFRHKPERKDSNSGLRRQDSGYGSIVAGGSAEGRPKSAGQSRKAKLIPTNTMKLEFSNYAHVDVKRRGAKSKKRYEFEYWGVGYAWKRVCQKEGDATRIAYHLTRTDDGKAVAHIVPVALSKAQTREEAAKGGWIPPCSMWISDSSILEGVSDLSDVVVATGVVALADDSIKNHFHSKQTTHIHIPLSRSGSFKLNMDYVGPKRLIDEVFHRTTRGSTSLRGPTPLRRASDETG
ncbi:uncharacterized protein K452DRAFT_288145 [Aplosporella prunicola CBS 121167]|uniref:Uncharacterized protein n=1 Tax=Aplosporella prunicola CBS 121167 TaxID=1176127 RepID=A0A6A6BDX0_9PEZI|nr:uncharacterized protein K452DRAFT_288145 [Aplosporella prunicola CBS 121167]KAF2141444.1 hypothetical protein K452DRAFT_288145 [Aplosporella prunicola CBS 121167]